MGFLHFISWVYYNVFNQFGTFWSHMKGKPESLILFLFPLSANSRGLCDPVQYKLVDQKCGNTGVQQTPSPLGPVEEWSQLSLQEVLGLFAFLKNGSICGRLIAAFPKVGGGRQAPQRAAHLSGQWRVKNKRVTTSHLKAPSGQIVSSFCPSRPSTSLPEVSVSIRVWRVSFPMALWFPAWRYSRSLWVVFISCHFPRSGIQIWTRVWHFPSGNKGAGVGLLWAELWDAFWSVVGGLWKQDFSKAGWADFERMEPRLKSWDEHGFPPEEKQE